MLAIAFEGCACRSSFHAGVAAALDDAGLRFPLTAGTSSGSVVAVSVAAGLSRELPARYRALAGRSIVSLRRALHNRSPFDMSHLVRTALEGAVSGVDLRGMPAEALVVATRARDLTRVVFSSREEPDMVPPVLGSCFVPLLYGRSITHRGELLLDGGVVDNLPLEALRDRGATEILAVVTNDDGTAMKTLRERRWCPAVDGARLHVLHPRRPLPARSWDLDADRMARSLEAGYACGRAFAGG